MPIRGLTDRGLAFPQIGSIKLGTKKVNQHGKEYPSDLTFFRVMFDDQEAEAVQLFISAYGKLDVDEINIMFPFNSIDRVWDVWLEAYTAGRMWARSDGEFFQYLVDPKGGEPLIVNGLDKDGNQRRCNPDEPVGKDNKGQDVFLKPTGRLKVVIPELMRGAYLVLRTGSYHNVANISAQLAGIQEVVGRIAGIPLVLRRRPKEVSTPDDREKGKRVRRTKWLVSIEISPVWMRRQFGEFDLIGLPIGTGPAILPEHAGGDEEEFEEFAEGEGEEIIDAQAVEKVAATKNGNGHTPSSSGPDWSGAPEHDEDGNLIVQPAASAPAATNGKAKKPAPFNILDWMIAEGLAENDFAARAIFDLLEFGKNGDTESRKDQVRIYRSWRETGAEAKVAAVHTLAGNLPESAYEQE